ncbi:MAG TPA: hypothetical protein VM305_06605 [Candidatus Limnocylindrales bacterium]|nr:hypothetical protein [Candidatus Limnocylindrales bacterium]
MHDALEAPPPNASLRAPQLATLQGPRPSMRELFSFMSEAELRFRTLRMRIVDRRFGAAGENSETSEVWLRHPGRAKVIQWRGAGGAGRDFDVWLGDGERVRTYDARNHVVTDRTLPPRPVGSTRDDLPGFARVHVPVTPLPPESLANTFIHPHGFAHNVLASGVVRELGTTTLANGREALILRCDHPRISHVLTDRPDHWLELGVDRQTGVLLLLAEHIGGRITRHAEVTALAFDETLGDEIFTIHVSADATTIY